MPWKLEFHYKGCPDDFVKLNKSGAIIDVSYIKHSYINSLKESTATRTGSANEIIAQMKKNEEEQLLLGIQKHNSEMFWQYN